MNRIEQYLQRCISRGDFPGAVYLVAKADKVLAHGALGWASLSPNRRKMRPDMVFDVASFTKPMVTAALYLRRLAQKKIKGEDPIRRYLPEARGVWWGERTIEQLLTHTSGLPAWYPLYLEGKGRASYLKTLKKLEPAYNHGTRVEYSCLGYIVLGMAMETLEGESLDRLYREEIAAPLGLRRTRFNPPAAWKKDVVPTEKGRSAEKTLCTLKGLPVPKGKETLLWGKTHDGNAAGLGGVSGNAGLFSTAGEIHQLAACILGRGKKSLYPPEAKHLIFHNFTPRCRKSRSYGWQIASTPGSSAGRVISYRSIGHTGFTGTSLWLDPRNEKIYILLTNRVHPTPSDADMNATRREFHKRAARL